jgi:hypothetical protein
MGEIQIGDFDHKAILIENFYIQNILFVVAALSNQMFQLL